MKLKDVGSLDFVALPQGCDTEFEEGVQWILEKLDALPEIVRCGECEFGKMPGVTHDKERYRLCVVKAPRIVGVRSFCSYGRRKVD